MRAWSIAILTLLAGAPVAAQQPPKKDKPAAPTATAQPPAAPKTEAKPAATKAEAKGAPDTKRRSDGTTATADQIKEAQQALAGKGLYQGKITGRLNQGFRAALKKYQEQNGLKPTGRLNQETIAKLHQG